MSEEKQQMYKIIVGGEVVHGGKQDTKRAEFKEEFILPLKDGEALSQIQNKLIAPVLRKKFPMFKHVRTCAIISQSPVSGKVEPLKAKDIPAMTLEQLNQFCAEKQLNLNLGGYASTEEARKALTIHLDDLKLQLAKRKKDEAKKAQALKKAKAADSVVDDPSQDEFLDK